MNLTNVLELQNTYRAELAQIAEAMAAAAAVKATGGEANSAATGTLVSRVKAFATLTHEAGADGEEARRALTGTLTTLEMPKGSVKASGNHFAGFRKLIDEGKDIAPLSTKDAQEAVESDEVKAIKAAKSALNKYAKDQKWKSADWNAALELIGVTVGADAEDEEVEREARAA